MKKVYQSAKYKNHQEVVQEKELENTRRRKKYLKDKNKSRSRPQRKVEIPSLGSTHNISKTYKPHKKKYQAIAPVNFSLVNNINEMLVFFDDMQDHINRNYDIEIDMRNITDMTPDSLLYFVSFLEFNHTEYNFFGFSGYFPLNSKCYELFSLSGLFDLMKMKSVGGQHFQASDIVQLRKGKDANTALALQIREFAKNKIRGHEPKMRRIYGSIIDCMSNTKDHAYNFVTSHKKWYLMAIYDHSNNKINFVFLDNGDGIPTTVNKKFSEKLARILPFFRNDSHLIKSALEGEFKRTATGQAHRGLGLPSIFDYFKNGSIENFVVISNKGMVKGLSEIELVHKFNGTLLSWELT